MSLLIQPFEKTAAMLFAGLIISAGQKGDSVAILKRANTALAVSQGLSALAQGNATPGIAALESVLADQNLDPAVSASLTQAINLIIQQVSFVSLINSAIPLVGATAEIIAQNIADGVTAAANAEIAKYGPK